MKPNSYSPCLSLLFTLLVFPLWVNAQGNPWYPEEDTLPKPKSAFWHSREHHAKSLTLIGGYENGGFKVAMLKAAYEYKHWSGGVELYRQWYQHRWDSADVVPPSTGMFRLNAFSVVGRYYLGTIARHGYLELGAGVGSPRITVTYPNNIKKWDQWKFQFFQFGGGWRLGFRPRGFFGEIGYKGYFSLHRLPMLQTDNLATPVWGRDGDPIQYHIWYIRRFRLTNQVLVGLGYSF